MVNEYIPKLIRAAINNDKKSLEMLSVIIGRQVKKENPEIAKEIMEIVSCIKTDTDVMRSIDLSSVPTDKDSHNRLAKIEEPIKVDAPILDNFVMDDLEQFIAERKMIDKFIENDIVPSNSLLLYGKPGVGKTYIAKWISYKLNTPIVSIDLATSISSYLGRSGQNIKEIFQYAKEYNSILFLDEIDAIAKKRDDEADMGELKRLVNVLLKELEDCPLTCIIIGATNHPELLDKAIWRRFDRNIEIKMPGNQEREELIKRSLKQYYSDFDKSILKLLIEGTENMSAANICKMCEHIKRKIIISPEKTLAENALKTYCDFVENKTRDKKIEMCKTIKKNSNASLQKIANITGLPKSTVSRYVKE